MIGNPKRKKIGQISLHFTNEAAVSVENTFPYVLDAIHNAPSAEEMCVATSFPFLFVSRMLKNFSQSGSVSALSDALTNLKQMLQSQTDETKYDEATMAKLSNKSLLGCFSKKPLSIAQEKKHGKWTYICEMFVTLFSPELIVNFNTTNTEDGDDLLHRSAMDVVLELRRLEIMKMFKDANDSERTELSGAVFNHWVEAFLSQVAKDGVSNLLHSYSTSIALNGDCFTNLGKI